MKTAVLSMDVEDWFHLDYFRDKECDTSYSMLDGVAEYLAILDKYQLKSTFFVLGEVMAANPGLVDSLIEGGHDVGSHGWRHIRPVELDLNTFSSDLQRSMEELRKKASTSVLGFRAPCFGMKREQLNEVAKIGFSYDSSLIDFGAHPLYERIDMHGFQTARPSMYSLNNFVEFEVTTSKIFGRSVPISGGGYLRLLPWFVTKNLLLKYLDAHSFYCLYIHPFELSASGLPPIPANVSRSTALRFSGGHSSVAWKLEKVIQLLLDCGYRIKTFADVYLEIQDNFLKSRSVAFE